VTVTRIAHRGYAGENPENTALAARRAAGAADAVEVDLRRCGSGEIVCCHDETVDRVTDASGPVSSFSADELASLSVLGSGEGVPTLGAVLDAVPGGVALNAELKEDGIAGDALSTLRETPREVIVSSFSDAVLREARSARERPGEVALASLHAVSGGIEEAVEHRRLRERVRRRLTAGRPGGCGLSARYPRVRPSVRRRR